MKIGWRDLKEVTFKERFDVRQKNFYKIPAFGPSVKRLAGKRIVIKGYMIPVSLPDHLYVISENPMSSCFFCGSAGPETLMEVVFRRKEQRFKTDEIRTLNGVLELNETDQGRMIYLLTAAEVSE